MVYVNKNSTKSNDGSELTAASVPSSVIAKPKNIFEQLSLLDQADDESHEAEEKKTSLHKRKLALLKQEELNKQKKSYSASKESSKDFLEPLLALSWTLPSDLWKDIFRSTPTSTEGRHKRGTSGVPEPKKTSSFYLLLPVHFGTKYLNNKRAKCFSENSKRFVRMEKPDDRHSWNFIFSTCWTRKNLKLFSTWMLRSGIVLFFFNRMKTILSEVFNDLADLDFHEKSEGFRHPWAYWIQRLRFIWSFSWYRSFRWNLKVLRDLFSQKKVNNLYNSNYKRKASNKIHPSSTVNCKLYSN